MGLTNPSRETKFSGANAGGEIFIFPVQLTTSRNGYPVDPYSSYMCDHTYIHMALFRLSKAKPTAVAPFVTLERQLFIYSSVTVTSYDMLRVRSVC